MQEEKRYIFSATGMLKGILKDGVRVFKGITYARYSPFREAVPEKLQAVTDATSYGTVCPQRSSRTDPSKCGKKLAVVEDGRLCLSVYSPENARKLPVMVWIHGGSFIRGGSEERRYGCERMAREGNVVVVKISYRLGAFGYLYLPERGICNLGLKDQKTALGWIREYADEFGGDPSDITVFGQSAGALSIAALVATAEGPLPFRKAILQSAPLGITITPSEASKITGAFLRKLGKDPEEATVDELLDAQKKVLGMKAGLTFMPMVEDFLAIPSQVRNSGFKAVVGYAADDASPFVSKSGKFLNTFFGRKAVRHLTESIFSKASDEYADRLEEAGIEVTRYFISWHPEGNRFGSCHCIELPFLLGDREEWSDAGFLNGMTDTEYSDNSRDILRAWTTFARDDRFPGGGILEIRKGK
ncbi:MAG: carboxylesterase family protein [Candidatus Cryptobacteroides sp.]